MMCEACGSVVRPPYWRCDCTRLAGTAHLQRIIPVMNRYWRAALIGWVLLSVAGLAFAVAAAPSTVWGSIAVVGFIVVISGITSVFTYLAFGD